MQKTTTALVVLFLLSISAFGQNKFTLSGRVLDSSSMPLPGASVYIYGTNNGASCDRNGYFELKGVGTGEQHLRASFTGYKKYREVLQVTANVDGLVLTMEETTGTLGEIVVTGTGTPHHIKTAPVPTELFTSQEIERISAPNVSGLLQTISPSFDFTPTGMGSNMKLNGLGGDYITILVDGKRMSGDVGGMNDLSRISTSDIERIEVVKGASSSLYGSDAIGGVINIITKKNRHKVNFVNNTYVSGYGTLNQDNSFGFNAGRLSGKTHVSYQQTDGWKNSPYRLTKGELVESDHMTVNPHDVLTLDQSLNYNITDKISVSGFVSTYEKELRRPITVSAYDYVYNDFTYNLGAEYLLNKTDRVVASYHSDQFIYSYKYNQNDTTRSQIYPKDTLIEQNKQVRSNADVKYLKRWSKNNMMSLGAEYVNEIYSSEGRVEGGEADVYTASLYGQDEHTFFNTLDMVAGLRFVCHEEFGPVVTPKLSLLYKMDDKLNLRATYSRGFKAPTLKELYYRYEKSGKLYLGNTDLDPQVSDYYSCGLDYHNDVISVSVSQYLNNVYGMIAYETIETTPEDEANGIGTTKQHFNIDHARTQGFDINLRLNLPAGFTVGAGHSYVDARNVTTDERLEYVAKNYFTADVNYAHSWTKYDLSLSFIARMQDEKYYTDGPAPAYELYKLASVHTFAPMGIVRLSATAGIDNIFDYVEETPYSGNKATVNPGRTFYASLIIQLTD